MAYSHSAIFIRLADAHPVVVAAARLGVAAAIMMPLAALRCRAEWRRLGARELALVALSGVLLAGLFASWITSLRYTSIANSVVLFGLSPVWIALVSPLLGWRVGRLMVVSVVLSIVGSAIIGWGSASGGERTGLFGDGLATIGGLCMAAYLLLGERARRQLSLLGYVSLCYGTAAAILLLAVVILDLPVLGLTPTTYIAMASLGLICQVIGHSTFNWALVRYSPQLVAVYLLGDVIFASLLGLLYFRESIAFPTLVGGGLMVVGIYLGIRAGIR